MIAEKAIIKLYRSPDFDILSLYANFTSKTMKSSFSQIINSETPVLVDFYADWCGPCKTLAPILKNLKEELGDAVKIVKIDVDKNQPLAVQYQVRGVPTMILFKNGKQVWRQSGVLQKEALKQVITSY